MPAALLALVLAASSLPPSVTLKYEAGQEGALRALITLRAQGPRLRVDDKSRHLTVVLDDAKKLLTFTDVKPGACYALPYAQRTELQVLAERREEESQRTTYESLAPPDRLAWRSHFDRAVAEARSARPQVQTLTWMRREKLERACELYQVTEAGADVGTICLETSQAAPKTLTVTAPPGEWWQGANALLEQGLVPVKYERKLNGIVQWRANLVSVDRAAFPASVFVLGKRCESGQALAEKP